MDGDERTGEAEHVAHFGQRRVRTFPDDSDHAAPVRVRDLRLPPGPVIQGADLADGFALLDKFFHHSKGDAETLSYRVSRPLFLIIAGKYTPADIEG